MVQLQQVMVQVGVVVPHHLLFSLFKHIYLSISAQPTTNIYTFRDFIRIRNSPNSRHTIRVTTTPLAANSIAASSAASYALSQLKSVNNPSQQYYQQEQAEPDQFEMYIVNKLLVLLGCVFFAVHFALIVAVLAVYCLVRSLCSLLMKRTATSLNPIYETHPDVFRDSMEMIVLDGFRIDEYLVKTEDDYTVTLWRVVNLQQPVSRPHPVFLQHGLLDCSISWFLHSDKNRALPYILSKLGFDVWVGNNRGTKYSQQEKDREGYWNFGFDELAKYDVPAFVSSILKESGAEKMIYIGHSQGSTQFKAALIENPELGEKIQAFVALGPVISLNNVDDHMVLNMLAKYPLLELYKMLGFKTLLHLPPWMNRCVGVLIYNTGIYFKGFHSIVNLLCGYPNENNFDMARFGVIIAHEPGGASVNNILQWVQFARSKQFRKFDHGAKKNVEIYGHHQPPAYNFSELKQHKFPKYLFRGTKDSVVSERDFQTLIDTLDPETTFDHHLADYAHLDYIWGVNSDVILYHKIGDILTGHSS